MVKEISLDGKYLDDQASSHRPKNGNLEAVLQVIDLNPMCNLGGYYVSLLSHKSLLFLIFMTTEKRLKLLDWGKRTTKLTQNVWPTLIL